MKKLLLSAIALLFSITSWAQEIEEKPKLEGEVSSSLSALRLASDLVKYGYAQQSALSLAEALQLMNDNPTQPLKAEREGQEVDTSKSEGKSNMFSLDYDLLSLEDHDAFHNIYVEERYDCLSSLKRVIMKLKLLMKIMEI